MCEFGKMNYTSTEVPTTYRCNLCGVHGVKLWREYNAFANQTELTCCKCTHESEGKPLVMDASSQIGWRVAAVPSPNGDGFWGYSSVPKEVSAWWYRLPAQANSTQASETA